jgi:hypothetical protein
VPKKLGPGERTDGTIEVAAALADRVPLPPQAILTFFPDVAIEADNAHFLKVHGRFTVLEGCRGFSRLPPRLAFSFFSV